MVRVIILIVILGYFLSACGKKWKKFSFLKKLTVKIVAVYLALGLVLLMGMYLLYGVTDLYDNKKRESLEERLQSVENYLNDGSYHTAKSHLTFYECYEEEFEFAWERLIMYELYNRYNIRTTAAREAAEAGREEAYVQGLLQQADIYQQELLGFLENSVEPKNKLFVDYYKNLLYNQ